jgi:nucleotide-binding universal stress UspA family protein
LLEVGIGPIGTEAYFSLGEIPSDPHLRETPTAISESPSKEMAGNPMVHARSTFDNSIEAMAKETLMFAKILVAVDETEQAQWALEAAINLARVAKGELTLVHVVKSPFDRAPYRDEQLSQQILERSRSMVPPTVKTQIDSRKGNVVAEIVGAAEETDAELIVMGTHGRGPLPQLLLGSTTEGVARWAPCPVLTVRQPCKPGYPFRRILAAVDASEPALAALALALGMAHETDAAIAVVHVVDTAHPWQGELNESGLVPLSQIRRQGQLLLKRMLGDLPGGDKCDTILRDGLPAKEILVSARIWEADLIVIGSQGHGHFEQFVLGSVANAVVRGAFCPILLVRPQATTSSRRKVRNTPAFQTKEV